MDNRLWDLFRETGEPMGYLLYRAEKKQEKKRGGSKAEKASEPPKGTPPAST